MMGLLGFILWVFVTAVVVSFLFWSTFIALAQKKAWSEFAKRYKLTLEEGERFRDPVAVTGTLNGRILNIYSEIEQDETERTQRIYTHVEVFLNDVPKTVFVISKSFLPKSMQDLVPQNPFTSTAREWPAPVTSHAAETMPISEWMTPARMKTLKDFMTLTDRSTDVFLMGNGESAFLLWRGQKPLTDPRELNALVQKLYGFARDFDGTETGAIAKPNPSSDTEPADKPA